VVEQSIVSALGLGLALAGAPGPVQAVLFGEALRGGVTRGLRALVGVHSTFGTITILTVFGLSAAAPSGALLRLLEVAGGCFLLWVALDSLRDRADETRPSRGRLPPEVRGSLAIILNPGGWLFVATVVSSLLAVARARGGSLLACAAAVALVIGAAAGDMGVVILGALGPRRLRSQVVQRIRTSLALVLAGFGGWLIARGVVT
jgi:threonine/homoserine/homoserine lactone efflux protein